MIGNQICGRSECYAAFLLGYLSHMVADSLTESGVQWFYPYTWQIRFVPKAIAVRTGSMYEMMLLGVLALVLIGSVLFFGII